MTQKVMPGRNQVNADKSEKQGQTPIKWSVKHRDKHKNESTCVLYV